MGRKRPEQAGLTAPLSPDDADVLRLVWQNLQILAELRARYRSAERGGPNGQYVRSPKDAADLLHPEMEPLFQEQLRVILLNSRNRVLDVVMVYQGNVHTVLVRMAELFRNAIIANAPAIVIVHNHPSGEAEPSSEDFRMTKEAAQAAKLLGIELLDHIVLGHGHWVSLKERGVL